MRRCCEKRWWVWRSSLMITFIPYSTYVDIFGDTKVSQIIAHSDKDVVQVIASVKKLLLKRLKSDEFSVFETTELKVINKFWAC